MGDILASLGTALKHLTVPVLIGIFIATSLLLFLPVNADKALGLLEFRKEHLGYISLTWIASGCLLLGHWLVAGWGELQRRLAPAQGALVITPVERPNALWWSHAGSKDGKKPYRQVVGDFNVTNTTDKELHLVRAILRLRRWALFHTTVTGNAFIRDALTGYSSGSYPIAPHSVASVRVHFLVPVREKPAAGRIVVDLGIEDQFARKHRRRGLVFKDSTLPMEDQ